MKGALVGGGRRPEWGDISCKPSEQRKAAGKTLECEVYHCEVFFLLSV